MIEKPTYGELEQRVRALEQEVIVSSKAEERYRTIFNSANDAIMVHDANTGRPLDINPKMTELLGYGKDEIMRMKVAQWSIGDAEHKKKEAIQKIKAAADGKPQLFEWHARTKDNRRIWLEVNLKAAVIGGEKKVVAVVRNITERKLYEKALRDSEQRFRDLIESTSDWVWEADCNGVYTYSSPTVKEAIGYHPDEVIGKTPFDFMPPEEAKRIADIFLKIVSAQERFDSLENTNLHKNGTLVVMETSGVPFFNPEGDCIGYRGIDRVITDRKIAESEREELVAQLNHARKMESIGTLAGGIAHDFNNLLYMIIGNAELVLEDIPEWHPVYDSTKEIRGAGLRAASIVKQLLNFSRKAIPELVPVSAMRVVQESLDFLRSTLPANIKIRIDLPDDDWVILADPIQMSQLMMNICVNAAQAMEKTGGVVDINIDSATLSDDSAGDRTDLAPGTYVKITIGDTGPGIEPEIIGRIFEPYFTTKEVGEGSGMGLAVVHGIVNSHNGIITVDSEMGKGAVFTILIPHAVAKEGADPPKQDPVPEGSERILFIDDEASIVKMVKRLLEKLGYLVKTCTSPVEALDWFRKHSGGIDLVITDMTMPEMTGDKLAVELMKIKPEIPVILCTGYSKAVSDETADKIGIRSYVYKPIIKTDLAKTIRKVLDGSGRPINRAF